MDPQTTTPSPVSALLSTAAPADHRCLYGHRVQARFAFAIQSRQCPMCGAPTISIQGYQAARRLADELHQDALVAFNTLRLLEQSWRLVPIDVPTTATPSGQPSPVVAEIELSDDDLDLGEPTPPPTAAPLATAAPVAPPPVVPARPATRPDDIPSTFGA